MTYFLNLCFAGFALGCRYALVALGFVIIYKATGVINFAQGSLVALGAYLAYNFHHNWSVPFPLAVVLAVAATAVIAAVIERVLLGRVIGQPAFGVIMITIGLLFVLDQVVTTIWGNEALNLGDPWGIRRVTPGGIVVSVKDMWTVGLTAAVLVGFFAFFRYSGTGLAMRATAFDQEAALARGISVKRVFAVAWAVAGAVGAVAGITLASGPAALTPNVGFIALAAFPAMILGGLDSPVGAVIGGIIIGITQALTAGYQPEHASFLGNNFQVVMPYVVMIVILLIRPYGLFGTREVHRV